jgi:hypothetical protein
MACQAFFARCQQRAAQAALLVAIGWLAGCNVQQLQFAPRPLDTSARTASLEPAMTPESEALHAYYTRVEQRRLTDGLMRRDGGGPDTPFSARNVTDNFLRIALYDEHTIVNGRATSRASATTLRRWEAPVRMVLNFGATVPLATQIQDRATVAAYADRLSQLTRHPVSLSDGADGNFHILVVSEDERRNSAPLLREIIPGIDDTTIQLITEMPRSTFCLVVAFARNGGNVYTDAVAVVRSEHPDLTRLSCYHEELAQGLGLPNDSPDARPSIFNDAQEFALLTSHDEFLLRILYDRRLRPGLTEREARPIVTRIAQELMGGAS